MCGAGTGIQGSLFPQLCRSAKGLGAWACQHLRSLLDSSLLAEGIFSRAVMTMWTLKQYLGELFCLRHCCVLGLSHPASPHGETREGSKWDHCNTCTACLWDLLPAGVERNGSAVQRRAVVDESRASLARRGGCGVPCPAQFTLLHSLNLCVPHQHRQFCRGVFGGTGISEMCYEFP